jgi:hypothetical protein
MSQAFTRKVVPLAPLDDAAEQEISRLEALLRARRDVQHVRNQLRLHAERTDRVRAILKDKLAAAESHLSAVLATQVAA